jgi:hypothetical protein
MYRTLAFVILGLTLGSLPVYAGEDASPTAAPSSATAAEAPMPSVAGDGWTRRIEIGTARRPGALPALYVSLAALQAFDGYSTTAGLSRGAREANPMMQGIAGNTAAFWALKAGSTAASIWMAERMWKTNRVGAVVTMVAVNGVMATVAARNASMLNTMR